MRRILFIYFFSFCTISFSACSAQLHNAIYVEFGHHLFFDKSLSFNNTKSCSSCHDPKFAFTDGYRRSLGATAELHKRNATSLINVSDNTYLTAANPNLRSLEEQISQPLFNKDPLELGIREDELVGKLLAKETYQALIARNGLRRREFSNTFIIHSLAAYCREIHSYNSRYDQTKSSNGNDILSAQEQEGEGLFFSQRLGCSDCHGGRNFNSPAPGIGLYQNNGFTFFETRHISGIGKRDEGVFDLTGRRADRSKFRIPSLRNVLVTAPYMHDGEIASLGEVIDGYATGGLNKENVSTHIHPFQITEDEKRALIAFLGTLTDLTYLDNPLFTEPKRPSNK